MSVDDFSSCINQFFFLVGYQTINPPKLVYKHLEINKFLLFVQDVEIPTYVGMHYQLPYTPLMLEDFPQINLPESKSTKPEMTGDCMLYDRYKDCMGGTLEEIISLCCSQDNPVPFPC